MFFCSRWNPPERLETNQIKKYDPLVNIHSLLLKPWPSRFIVDLPINSMVDLSIVMWVITRLDNPDWAPWWINITAWQVQSRALRSIDLLSQGAACHGCDGCQLGKSWGLQVAMWVNHAMFTIPQSSPFLYTGGIQTYHSQSFLWFITLV